MNTFSFIRCRDLPLGTWVCSHNDDDGSSDDDNNSNTNDDDRTMCIASTYDSFLLSKGVGNRPLQERRTNRSMGFFCLLLYTFYVCSCTLVSNPLCLTYENVLFY